MVQAPKRVPILFFQGHGRSFWEAMLEQAMLAGQALAGHVEKTSLAGPWGKKALKLYRRRSRGSGRPHTSEVCGCFDWGIAVPKSSPFWFSPNP